MKNYIWYLNSKLLNNRRQVSHKMHSKSLFCRSLHSKYPSVLHSISESGRIFAFVYSRSEVCIHENCIYYSIAWYWYMTYCICMFINSVLLSHCTCSVQTQTEEVKMMSHFYLNYVATQLHQPLFQANLAVTGVFWNRQFSWKVPFNYHLLLIV